MDDDDYEYVYGEDIIGPFDPWFLWLDDLAETEGSGRQPRQINGLITRTALSSEEAERLISRHGMPQQMSLDFDLGGTDTTMTFLRNWTQRWYRAPFPPCRFHTSNPVGREQMRSFVNSWNESLKGTVNDEN